MSYIILRAGTKKFKNKKKLSMYLKKMGCSKIKRNLWKLPRKLGAVKQVKKQLDSIKVSYILLRRKRALKKLELDQNNVRLGSLILVAYSFPNRRSTRVRKHVSRLLRRSPYLRIDRNIYAWPQIKFKNAIPQNKIQGNKIISPRKFVNAIQKLGGETSVISRLVVEEHVAHELIGKMKRIRTKECSSIYLACKKLINQVKEFNINVITARRSFNEIKARFIQTKEIIFFLKKFYKIDLMKPYRKALRSINRCKRILQMESRKPSVSIIE